MKTDADVNQSRSDKENRPKKTIPGSGEHVCPWWVGYLLNLPMRKWFESPKKVLGPLVQPGMTVLDVGCAMGFFSIPLARMVGPNGRVVCVDLQEKMVRALRRRAERAGLLDRMEIRISSKNSLDLETMQGEIDLVCALFVIHEMPDQSAFFDQAYDLLKPAGQMLVMEPRGHVSAAAFHLYGQWAEGTGFNQVPYRQPRMRHAMLLKKGDV